MDLQKLTFLGVTIQNRRPAIYSFAWKEAESNSSIFTCTVPTQRPQIKRQQIENGKRGAAINRKAAHRLGANLLDSERKEAFMPRISWIEESDARDQLADLFAAARSGSVSGIPRDRVPDIFRTMSHRPDFFGSHYGCCAPALFRRRTYACPT